jgi:hypothetical protein
VSNANWLLEEIAMFKHACSLFVLGILLLIPTSAGAHRLDEYLQATRVEIERNRVNVDIDLTAGVSIAREVATWIDVNSDGEISPSESLAYGRQVLGSLALAVDGDTVPLTVLDAQAPTIAEMAMGLGTLRVRASAIIPSRASGRHRLTIINTHHPESSVYLANALVPSDKRIEILGQRRSTDQHSLAIEYEIGVSAFRARIAWLGVVVTLVATTFWARRRLGHFSQRQTSPI